MNVVLWIVQGVLAAIFLMAGVIKTSQPREKLLKQLPWVEDFSTGTVRFIGLGDGQWFDAAKQRHGPELLRIADCRRRAFTAVLPVGSTGVASEGNASGAQRGASRGCPPRQNVPNPSHE